MTITPTVKTILETASAKALATTDGFVVNVVPVSMIKVYDSSIWLFDFFMDRTAANIIQNPACALTAWDGMKGIQLKGNATYITEGAQFDEAVAWVATENPDRVVKGLLEITPIEIFDSSPGGAYSEVALGME